MTRQRSSSGSVILRRLRRLRVSVLFYTCGSLCVILLLVNFNEDVKRLLQQSHFNNGGPHEGGPTGGVESSIISSRDVIGADSGASGSVSTRREINNFISSSSKTAPSDDPQRYWFMWRGSRYPRPGEVDGTKLWYEEDPNSDRIVPQLMFALKSPQNYSEHSISRLMNNKQNNNNININNDINNNIADDQPETVVSVDRRNTDLVSSGGTQSLDFNYNSSKGPMTSNTSPPSGPRLKTILLYYGLGMSWGPHVQNGRHVFLQQKCPVNSCKLTGNRAHMSKADAVLFKDVFMNPKVRRPPNQLWIMYMLECPLNTQNFVDKNVFNLTATYRHDSDIVTPYEKWVYYDDRIRALNQAVNYSAGKRKKVAWFVSNCVAKNNRLEFAKELSKYIEVDIYGACGTHSCSRANAKQCFELLSKHYKFYLAFENSNCRDYISEKFFVNGLGNNIIPIVMGAHPDDYKRVAPDKSYVHVDDFASPRELAEYLKKLDENEELYNEYFKWKGTGEFINTHFFCRLCAALHSVDLTDHRPRLYEDFNRWWRGPNVCIRRSWRNQPDIFSPDYYLDKPTTNQDSSSI